MKKIPLFFLLLAIAIGCKKQTAKDTETGQVTVELNNCAEAENPSNLSRICFEQVNDSRCPANAVCVLGGVAIAKFSFTANGTQHRFSLFTPSTKDTLIAGYRFKLLDVTPYPGTGSTDPVRAVLSISR